MAKGSVRVIASNKKARHDYFIEDTYEAGIVLHGTEVKSLRQGHCSIKESFVRIDNGEVIIYGMHINPYEKGNIFNKDPLRPKKLMLHKYEINKLVGKLNEKGLAWHEARSYMTSVRILQSVIWSVKMKESLSIFLRGNKQLRICLKDITEFKSILKW